MYVVFRSRSAVVLVATHIGGNTVVPLVLLLDYP